MAIYYFSDPKDATEGERVYRIDIAENGDLSRPFGKGFYDETNNIIMEMMFHNMSNNKN